MQRIVVCLITTAVWSFELWAGRFDPLPYQLGILLSIGYLLLTVAYLQFGNWERLAEGKFLYFFLVSDPPFFISTLVLDPHTFAFLHPLLLVIVVRSGIRYGLRYLETIRSSSSWFATQSIRSIRPKGMHRMGSGPLPSSGLQTRVFSRALKIT